MLVGIDSHDDAGHTADGEAPLCGVGRVYPRLDVGGRRRATGELHADPDCREAAVAPPRVLGGCLDERGLDGDQDAVGGVVAIEWYPGGSGDLRDPFQAKSEWRSPRPDPLGLPPYGSLQRRVPLPAPVARAPRAWPGREMHPPEDLEDEPPDSEGGTR